MTDTTDPAYGFDYNELDDWFDSLDDLLHRYGREKTQSMLCLLQERAFKRGAHQPFTANTPYINTIPAEDQPPYPGNRDVERRIKSIIRWNAMAMVVRANRDFDGVGGHISTYASSATLYEVGFNQFFHARTDDHTGDMVYFQGHASPGVYARAYLEGRISEEQLIKFRRESERGTGLCSYPHPWLMEDFWQFPTVSMGLGPITAIYHARFLEYLNDRGLLDTTQSKVWAFLGDGETDEPESLGALTLASREQLDNLIFVVNCNLQRLDGPVRGNGKIIQELEANFRGAGWNVIKVVWGSEWDAILENDTTGELVRRMGEVVDGYYQKYKVEGGAYIREHFFNTPYLKSLVAHLSDEQLAKIRRGGHDPEKVHAAYQAAVEHKGSPTVILAKTIKGYGLGEAGEGRNVAHNVKKANEQELREFRNRFGIPISDENVEEIDFYRPSDDDFEMQYLQECRKNLGGYIPARRATEQKLPIPHLERFDKLLSGTDGKEVSTTMAFSQFISQLLKDKELGPRVVPIIPDEARTFGMEGLFRQAGIYAHRGQLYEPVDRHQLMYYKEARDGQILEEGINEAGAMSSFIAAGTSYSNLDFTMMPFYIYYSMFGFQRVGDLIWCAADSRAKGFMIGGTSGRTTLNGEGLQHEDGHSHLIATTVPNLVAYDPAFAYELITIINDGMRRMYVDQECLLYYISVYNENYPMPAMPAGCHEDILKGMYKLRSTETSDSKVKLRPQLFGSGTILNEVLRAQDMLASQYGIGTDVWSVTSYSELCREAMKTQRWNRLHPTEPAKSSYLEQTLQGIDGPFISSSDNVRLVADQVREWIPGDYTILGTDGFGRSDTRPQLRRHFEIDAECVTYATLSSLAKSGNFDAAKLPQVLADLQIDPEKVDPLYA